MMIVKQKGPTCGIYALLNGIKDLYNLKEFKGKQMHEVALKLLKENKLSDEKCSIEGNTFVGEFFVVDEYMRFINNNAILLSKEIVNNSSLMKFNASKVSFVDIGKDEDTFFIVPIIDRKNSDEEQTISHWVNIFPNKWGYKVINSNCIIKKICGIKKIQRENKKLEGCSFYWESYKRSRKFTLNPTGKKIEEHIECQLKKKHTFLERRILRKKIDYTVGEIIMIKKL